MLLFFRVRVAGLEKLPASGPYIICPNHQSYVDPFVLCGVLPYRVFKDVFFVGAPEYFEAPLTQMGRAHRESRCRSIPIPISFPR